MTPDVISQSPPKRSEVFSGYFIIHQNMCIRESLTLRIPSPLPISRRIDGRKIPSEKNRNRGEIPDSYDISGFLG